MMASGVIAARIASSPIKMTVFTNVIIMGFGMITGILTARMVGPIGRGEIALAMIWPLAMVNLGGMGISESLTFHSGKKEDRLGALICAGITLGLVQTVVFGTLGFWLIPRALSTHSSHVTNLSLIYSSLFVYAFIGNYAMAIIQGRMRFISWNLLRLISPSVYFLGILILSALDMVTTRNIILAALVGPYITIACAFVCLQTTVDDPLKWDLPLIRRVVRYGLSTSLSTVPQFLKENLDQLVMSIILSAAQLGLYSVSLVAAAVMQPLLSAFQTVTFSSTANQLDPQAAKFALVRNMRLGLWLGIACVLAYIVLLPYVIPLLYGPAFVESVVTGQILTIACFLTGLSQILVAGFRGLGMPKVPAVGNLVGLLTGILLLPTFVSRWNQIGAALAAVICSAVTFAALLRIFQSRVGLPLHDIFRPPNLAWFKWFVNWGSPLKMGTAPRSP